MLPYECGVLACYEEKLEADNNVEAIALQRNRSLGFYRIAEVFDKLLHERPRPVAVLIFASAHDKLDLDLVAVLQEFQRLFPANVKVMVADRQRKPDAFQFHFLLLGFILAFLPL